MARSSDRAPTSYDEIVRRTVIDPDSSRRPTRQQEREAHEGARILSDDEQRLQARISTAIDEPSEIEIEVDGTCVELRGQVPDLTTMERLEQRVAAIEGVTEVRNRLVIAPHT